MSPLARGAVIASWLGQLTAAIILAQTLWFKFTGAEESRHIFRTLRVEPWGRIGTGALEALAVLLLLSPRTAALGALLTLALMAGALGAHLTVLGIDVKGDGGLLFRLAVITAVAALLVLLLRWRDLPLVGARLARALADAGPAS